MDRGRHRCGSVYPGNCLGEDCAVAPVRRSSRLRTWARYYPQATRLGEGSTPVSDTELSPRRAAGRGERRLTLCENMRAVPYVPFYLALAGDFWRSEGLDISHVVSPSTAQTATKLLDGSVDVSWGGPMRVMMHHDADPDCPLVCFGQVVARDLFYGPEGMP